MTLYTLLENPNPHKRQYRFPRRANVNGQCVVHSAENVTDLNPPDNGAENVAHFISTRNTPGSYHFLADANGLVHVLPFEYEAWHDGTGSNSWTIGGSIACRASQWPKLLADHYDDWVVPAISWLAEGFREAAEWVASTTGIYVPAKRLSRAEWNAGKPGFVSHKDREDWDGTPGRRSDPGAGFPWDLFFEKFTHTKPPEEDDDMSAIQIERLANGYNAVRGNMHDDARAFYDPRVRDPKGWGYWIGRMNKEDPVKVVDEAHALLAKEAGL